MTSRLTLVCHGATVATRVSAFPADEPLEGRAFSAMGKFRLDRRVDATWISPMRAARQTAEALSLDGKEDPGLRDLDCGKWAGRTIADIGQEQPGRLVRWTSDPDFDDHGGESLATLLRRAGIWLDGQATARGRTVAITHAAVIRAMIVHIMDAPQEAFWRIDISPLSLTDLRHDGRRWAIRSCGLPLSAVASNGRQQKA